ncbi:MFS transporter [Kordiimonas lipolytica]|uniref:MFS transporter n=1 Tax=Kordiimonas lipolytica TaxID=1662421 RepID=A0ABV8U966_9PROT|nr:MFS transporter [Kordiimonas lipolytica]
MSRISREQDNVNSRGKASIRNMKHVFSAVLVFVAVASLQGTVVAYRAGLSEAAATHAAYLVAAYFAGLLGGAVLAPRLIRYSGHVTLFVRAALVASVALCGYAYFHTFWAWCLLQLVTGAAVACHYVVVESWFNLESSPQSRARVFSLYMVCWFIGAGLAPLLMSISWLHGDTIFFLMAAAVVGAGSMLHFGKQAPTELDHSQRMPLGAVLAASRVGFMGTLVVGVSFGAVFGLTAAFAQSLGWSEWHVSLFVAAFIVGGGAFQYPLGHLSDVIGRERVFMACALSAGVSAFCLLLPLSFPVMLAFATLFGGCSLPLYALSVSLVHDRLEDKDRLAASGGLLLLNGKGSFLGPLLIGVLAGLWGQYAVFIMLGAGHLLLFLTCLTHRFAGERLPSAQ